MSVTNCVTAVNNLRIPLIPYTYPFILTSESLGRIEISPPY